LTYVVSPCFVVIEALRHESFWFGQTNVFTVFLIVSHVVLHVQHLAERLTRRPNLKFGVTVHKQNK